MIRVGIRGISGLLGTRLAREIGLQSDMFVSFGTAILDSKLERFYQANEAMAEQGGAPLCQTLLLAERHRVVRQWQRQHLSVEPLDQHNVYRECDILVDATAPGVSQRYEQSDVASSIPVILQSGDYPRGRLIAPPVVAEGEGGIYRQGDCLLSGLAPIIAAMDVVGGGVKSIEAFLQMQYPHVLADYPTSQRICATYVSEDLASQLSQETASLFSSIRVRVHPVLQVPSLDYYTLILAGEFANPVDRVKLVEVLEQGSRMAVVGEGIDSTFQVDHLLRELAVGNSLPPICIYKKFLQSGGMGDPCRFQVVASLFSRQAAVLPNIEAIRMLAGS